MLVRTVMNKNVISTGPETSVKDAARIMSDNRIGSIVVKKGNKVVGIVTEHNTLRSVADGNPDKTAISEIMTKYVIYTTPESSIENAAKMMLKYKIKKLPVIKNDRLVGVITSTDIVAAEPKIIKDLKSLMTKNTKNTA